MLSRMRPLYIYRGSLYLRESLTCMGGSTVHKTVILEVRFNKVVMQIFCIATIIVKEMHKIGNVLISTKSKH